MHPVLANTVQLAAANTRDTAALVTLVVLALVVYAGTVLIFPWKKCVMCQDRKKFFAPWSKRTFQLCPRCRGKGKEFRVLARIVRAMVGYGFHRHD